MNMSDEIESCKCGSDNILPYNGAPCSYAYVSCVECGRAQFGDTMGDVLAAWNTRPTPTAEMADLVEAVARAIDPNAWENWDEVRQTCYGSYGLTDEPEGRAGDPSCARWRHASGEPYEGKTTKRAIITSLEKARAAIAAMQAQGAEPAGEEPATWVCDGIPDAAIEAGMDALENVHREMQLREESETPELFTDWDEGMMVAAIYKAMAPKIASAEPAVEEPVCISDIIRDVAELPDRDSPDDWPEAMLVTGEELRIILERYLPATPTNP